jgi:hypothetical protein
MSLLQVSISGNILAAICAECSGKYGLLLGNRCRNTEAVITDAAIDSHKICTSLYIERYICDLNRVPTDCNDSIGIFSIRRFSCSQPSFKEVVTVRNLTGDYPRVILIITVPEHDGNWIYSIKYNLFRIDTASDAPKPIEMKIPNLSDGSNSNNDRYAGGIATSSIDMFQSDQSNTLSSAIRSIMIQQSVLSDAYSNSIIDDIKVSF